ncbi:MAG: VTT domain-containing protein [Lachnospiraceae bacterium]|nr:VTT domain-containing protein [Lachnospiraceae bacterium]
MHKKKDLTPRQQKAIKISALIIAMLVLAALTAAIAIPMLSFAKNPILFRDWVDDHYFLSALVYIGMVIFQIVAAFVPGEPFEIAAGFAFGSVYGSILCFIAEGIGSIVVLLLVRKFGHKLLEVFFSKEKIDSLKFLHSSKAKILIFAIAFILPGTPKDLLCYFGGITDIPLLVLILITSFGRIPSIVTSIIGGDAVGSGDYTFAIIVFSVTLLVSGIGLVIYNRYRKKRVAGQNAKDDAVP